MQAPEASSYPIALCDTKFHRVRDKLAHHPTYFHVGLVPITDHAVTVLAFAGVKSQRGWAQVSTAFRMLRSRRAPHGR